jgi:hypothetical protein
LMQREIVLAHNAKRPIALFDCLAHCAGALNDMLRAPSISFGCGQRQKHWRNDMMMISTALALSAWMAFILIVDPDGFRTRGRSAMNGARLRS